MPAFVPNTGNQGTMYLQSDPNFGGATSWINPLTGRPDAFVQGPNFGMQDADGRYDQTTGWASANPGLPYWNWTPEDTSTDLFDATVGNPMLYLGAIAGGFGGLFGGAAGAGAGAGGAMDMGIGTQGWMDYLGAQAAGAGIPAASLPSWLTNLPPGLQSAVMQILGGGAGGSGGTSGTGGGTNPLVSLLGIGSGLNTMFNSDPAVDPNMIAALWQAGQNTYNTSLDPQNALHDRTQQRVVDASRAGQSARGIAMSPYGAGLENQAVNNFEIDWVAEALRRQREGVGAFATAGNTAANAGVANNAQAFMQGQTGLNNLTTGMNGLFGGSGGGGSGGDPWAWMRNMFSPSQQSMGPTTTASTAITDPYAGSEYDYYQSGGMN